jgi:Reverse transcriptase (RNA-dependent DNA polymerase)
MVKSFDISKRLVFEAWEKVRDNRGAPGVDAVSVTDFAAQEKNNLYKLWNRMSAGSYMPGPVRAVEIPKDHGAGIRVLGVPNVVDRIAQTAVAKLLEEQLEPIFHRDSYGYRPGRSAHDALAVTRRRCWKQDWVLDLDIRAFLDASTHCSFRSLSWSEQPVLGCRGFDTQAFSASGADVDSAELALLDTVHDGLAGDAVCEGGFEHREPALGGVVDE